MEKEKTAVEWLKNNFETNETEIISKNIEVWFKIAKEMEEKQIVSAWENGYEEGAGVNDYSCFHGMVYYNKTFSL